MNKNEIKKSNNDYYLSYYESIFNRNDFSLEDLIELLSQEKKKINHGLCGSINLGNTCYLNSSIACLSNCYELTYYFLSKKFKKDINKSNKEGTKGNLAIEWYELLKEYWKSKKSKGNPSDIKKIIGNKVKIFKGYNQQDANEFMIYFLDLMNEDLNRSSKKPYQEIDEQKDGESDDECALRFWNYYVQRNDSIITDLFTGLFKCTVKCPQCSWVSITYEPFNILQLPIPKEKYHKPEIKKKVELFYVPKYGLYNTLRIQFYITNINITMVELIEEFKKKNLISFKFNKLFFYLVEEQLLKEIIFGDKIYKEIQNNFIFFCDLDENQNEKIYNIPLYFYYDNTKSAFPRFLFLNKNMKLRDLLNISYLYIRRFINPPKNEYIEKINKYFQDSKYIEKLIKLINKEFSLIFLEDNSSSEIENFINNKPFELILYNKKNNYRNDLFSSDDYNDEKYKLYNDNISTIIDYLIKYNCKIKIILKKNNPYIKNKIQLNHANICKEENNNFTNYNNYNNYNNNISIYDCFEHFKESENLKKNNEWYCKKCKKHILAEKQILFYYLPKLFIISLKRFKNVNDYYYKNNKYVDFPLNNLNLNEFVCGFNKKNNNYECFAICQHYGEMEGGHYTAICKNLNKNWYNYDDEDCYLCDEKNINSSQAYIIFFRKKT